MKSYHMTKELTNKQKQVWHRLKDENWLVRQMRLAREEFNSWPEHKQTMMKAALRNKDGDL